jgi:hypothetical protein
MPCLEMGARTVGDDDGNDDFCSVVEKEMVALGRKGMDPWKYALVAREERTAFSDHFRTRLEAHNQPHHTITATASVTSTADQG